MRTNRPVTVEVVGLLKNSVLQGNLLVSEAELPEAVSGYGRLSLFLDRAEDKLRRRRVMLTRSQGRLRTTLAEDGFDAVDAREQLASYLAVQNTYLSTFQSLGASGAAARDGWAGGGPIAERAGAAGGIGADAGGRVSGAAGWWRWCCVRTPCCCWEDCWLGSRRRESRLCRNGRRKGRVCRG